MEKIESGAFQVARKIFDSEIWLKKPAIWKVIWIYILGKVNHQPYKGLNRGEGFFNFSEEIRMIGIDCTPDKIKKFLQYARHASMISTTRSTRGIIIKVLNYNDYQELDNYRRTEESTTKAREKHERSTTIYNNGNNDNNNKEEKKEESSYAEQREEFENKEPEQIDTSFMD